MQDLELIAFQIISNVGSARSAFVNAIRAAKAGDFARAEKLIGEGEAECHTGRPRPRALAPRPSISSPATTSPPTSASKKKRRADRQAACARSEPNFIFFVLCFYCLSNLLLL